MRGREQKVCRGIMAEDTEGKCIKGVPVEFGDAVILLLGTWWITFGPDEVQC